MKSFFNKMTPFKTKQVKSPLDVSDFLKFDAPTLAVFSKFVDARFNAANQGQSDDEGADAAAKILVAKKRMYFDLKYRCGSEGRCLSANGAVECKFPSCFQCRPVAKGGEIFEERMNFELGQEDHPLYNDVVGACDTDDLPTAVQRLSKHLEKLEADAEPFIVALAQTEAKNGGTQAAAPEMVSPEKFKEMIQAGLPTDPASSKVYLAPDGKPFGIPKIDELVAMSMWRAVLLVNMDEEAEAVDSLLRLAKLLPGKEYSSSALAGAATWACFNDMEIRFYKSYCAHFPEFAPTKKSVLTKPFLLPKVVAACGSSEPNADFLLDHVVSAVFAKENSCLLSRAHASQVEGDKTEDPVASPVVKDSIQYYRHTIGGPFWSKFFALCIAPPIALQEGEERTSSPEAAMSGYTSGETPLRVMDSVARSMLLHHVTRDLEDGNNGDTSLPKSKEQKLSMQRMQELVGVVKMQAKIDQHMMDDLMAQQAQEEGASSRGPPTPR